MKSSHQKRSKKAGLSAGTLIHVGSKYIAFDNKICWNHFTLDHLTLRKERRVLILSRHASHAG